MYHVEDCYTSTKLFGLEGKKKKLTSWGNPDTVGSVFT